MISLWGKKNLCLILQTPERLTVYDPVPVSLKYRPDIALLFRFKSPLGMHTEHGMGTKILFLPLFQTFPYVHGVPFSNSIAVQPRPWLLIDSELLRLPSYVSTAIIRGLSRKSFLFPSKFMNTFRSALPAVICRYHK